MSTPVVSAIPLASVDLQSIDSSVGRGARPSDPALAVFEFVADELEAVGGTAVLEVDGDGMFCAWDPPSGPGVDGRRVMYLSHMLQAGLSILPRQMVANTAYAGIGMPLAQALLAISPLNPYVAERDSGILADAMPMSAEAWLAHGIVLMENGRFREASRVLARSAALDGRPLTLKCLAVCLTGIAPRRAVEAAEGMLSAYAREGVPPDRHARAAYGFALLAAGMRKDARAQFTAGFGRGLPAMTPRQWREWGSKVQDGDLGRALADPGAFGPPRKA